jgi:endonuclease III
MKRLSLGAALDALEKHYGAPRRVAIRDPFEQILAENASYLVDDATRARVFASLKKKIGTTPRRILAAPREALVLAIADGGMRPPMRAAKLTRAAEIAMGLDAPLAKLVRGPFDQIRRVLQRFPGVAEAGAQRIALFAGAHPLLGLESNGLRVLVRLGFAPEHASWDRTWRLASEVAQAELPDDVRAVTRAHLLLRRHGQETCKRSLPLCPVCPLAARCPQGAAFSRSSAKRARSVGSTSTRLVRSPGSRRTS